METGRRRRARKREKALVFIERPKCPFCGSAELRTRRTAQNGDATVTRDTICRSCDAVFLVVVE